MFVPVSRSCPSILTLMTRLAVGVTSRNTATSQKLPPTARCKKSISDPAHFHHCSPTRLSRWSKHSYLTYFSFRWSYTRSLLDSKMAPFGAKKRSIRQSLSILGIENTTVFESCAAARGDEFKIVRKIYLQLVLKAHPDKGGDPQVFREIQTSFELLRDLHTGKRRGAWLFSECLGGQDGKAAKAKSKQDSNSYDMKDYDTKFDSSEVPSWEHYEEAARQEVPIYSVELAKSGRSKCSQKGKTTKKCSQAPVFVDPRTCYSLIAQPVQPELISKGEIRVGSLLEDTGTYTRWHHLRCWRK